jgi:hypothetical protein
MKSLGKGLLCLIVLFYAINDLSAQNSSVTIGPGDLKSSAVLWLVPTGGQGLLLPSISTATRTSMSLNATDEKGMMVFDNQLNKVFYWSGSAWVEASGSGAGGSGTVTSVGLSLPSSVFGATTPITTSGNLTSTFNSQTAASVFAAPSGAAGVPSFRALTNTDIPGLDAGKITTGSFSVIRGGTGLTTAPSNGQILIGNGTGYALSTLTAGSGVSITNGPGTVTISSAGLSNPMTANGDIIFGGASGVPTRLAGSAGFLKSTGAAAPTWSTLAVSDIPNLDAAKISTGSFGVARGGTGLTTSPTNGQFLIGNGTGYSLTTLTQGTGVTITNGAGTVTISASGLSNPMTTTGDIIFGGASGTPSRLAGGAGVLKSTGAAAPTWGALNLNSAEVTGTLPLTQGGTGATTAALARTNLGLGSLSTLSSISTTEITNGTVGVADLSSMGATANQILQFDGSTWTPINTPTGGSGVTSVALSLPTIFSVTGSPVTTTGTLSATLASQTAATVFAAPAGAAGAPSFRALAATDLPNHDAAKITTGSFGVARGGTGLTATPTNGQVLIGNGTGYSLATLTQGSGVTITNGAGIVTIASTGLSNPMTTTGDIIFGGASGTPSRLAGGAGVLKSTGAAAPTWGALNLNSAEVTGTLPLTQGGTGATTAALARTNLGLGSLSTLSSISTTEITNGTVGVADLSSMGATANQILQYDGSTWTPINTPTGGSGVTSVALSLPTIFSVTGSPVTTTGTLSATLASQAAATVFAAPTGAPGAPSFRALAAADIPNHDAAKITTGSFGVARGGTGLTATPTNGQVLIGNGTGYSLATLTQGSGVTITNGAGTVTIASTGLTNPMTAAGDMIIGGGAGAPTRLAIGTGVLRSNGATQSWTSIDLASTDVTGILPVTAGGTGRATWDGLLLGSGSTISDISTGTNGQILKASGGSPSWQNFIVTDVEIQDNTIMNADINTAANIDGSKINTAFGNKNISTTGTLSSGAITATNLASINSVSYAWPASQGAVNSVLQNNGSGTLSWATVATAFSAANAIIKGNAAGSAQVASSMTDDGTTVSSTADINITTGNFYKINNQNFVGLTGTTSTHFGQGAGAVNTALHNTFVGFEAGNGTTTGEDNLFVGRRAGYSNVTAGYNTYLGKNAGYFNTTGLNTFIGWSAGYNTGGMLTGGSTFVGANAGYASTGSYNTFIGEQAGENNVGGEFNVFLGRITGASNIGGDQITLIGHGADVAADNLINATAIGYNAEVSTSSSLVLGGTGAQVVNVGIGVTGPSTDLHVVHSNSGGAANGDGFTIQNGAGAHSWTMFVSNSTGNLVLMQDLSNTVMGQFDDSNGAYTGASDRRLKKNINDLELVLPRISAMNIRRYHYKRQNDSDPTNIGVIAQELKEVFPELVKYAPEQDTYTVDYMSMAPIAIKAIQEQQTMIEDLQKQVTELQSKLKKEENTNSELSAKLELLLDDVEAIKKSVGLDQKAQNTPKK